VTLRESSAIDDIRLGCPDGGGTTRHERDGHDDVDHHHNAARRREPVVSRHVSLDNATTTWRCSREQPRERVGRVPDQPVRVVPDGFSDFNTDGDTLEIGWRLDGQRLHGPATFANCTFISTGGTPTIATSRSNCSTARAPNRLLPCEPTRVSAVSVVVPVRPSHRRAATGARARRDLRRRKRRRR